MSPAVHAGRHILIHDHLRLSPPPSLQVTAIIYISPLGIASLIASSICKTEDLARTVGALATFIGVYLLGLAILCLVLYPVVFWLCTQQSPIPVYRCLITLACMRFAILLLILSLVSLFMS